MTNTVDHIRNCQRIYKSLQTGFGSFYLFNFTLIQIFTILNVYRTISIWLTEGVPVLEMAVTSSGMMISTLAFLLNAFSLTLTVEDTFQDFKNLENMAKQDLGLIFVLRALSCIFFLVMENDFRKRQILKNLIDDIRQEKTLRED